MVTAWIDDDLQALDRASLRRRLRLTDQGLINFASNNYRALARHPKVISAAQEALAQWGAGAVSSRLLSGHTPLHASLETALARWLGQESALVFPTGYMANIGALTTLAGPGDAIIMDRLCHASLIDAARLSGARLLVYRHADADDAERVLKRASRYRRRVLVTESLFSMDGDVAPLAALRMLAQRYDALALVDDAHAIGVMGDQSQGLSAGWDVIVGTLSKSLGAQGGFVAATRPLIDYVINKARPFIFTTGLAPACVAAAAASLLLIQQTPEAGIELLRRAKALRTALQAQGWNTLQSQSQIIPVSVGDAKKALALAQRLREQGCFAPAIRPPAVHAGECRLRISLTLEHTAEQREQLIRVLGDACE